MLAAYLFQKEGMRNLLTTPAAAISALIWCILVISLTGCGSIRWGFVSLVPGFVAVAAGNTFFGLLSHPATRLLGTISYSVYLLHCIILMCALKALRGAIDFSQLQLHYYTLVLMGIGGFVVVCCSLTYRWIEHPALKWRTPIERRLSSRASQAHRSRIPKGQNAAMPAS
jgi:peptidoglycan/LPS O-acetylase OafA/YrhL